MMAHLIEKREYITVQAEPDEEPITLDEAKSQLQRLDNDEDALISAWITEARRYIEKTVGKTLVDTTFDYTIQAFPDEVELPRLPVDSVSQITYVDSDGVSQTLASSVYTVSLGSDEKKGVVITAKNQSWPSTYGHIDDVTVRFVAGYGTRHQVPETYKQMIRLYVDHRDKNRSATSEKIMHKVALAFDDLFYAEKSYGFV